MIRNAEFLVHHLDPGVMGGANHHCSSRVRRHDMNYVRFFVFKKTPALIVVTVGDDRQHRLCPAPHQRLRAREAEKQARGNFTAGVQ